MKLEWKKINFDGHKITQLVMINADDERKAIATIIEQQLNESEPKFFDYITHCILEK